MDIETFVDEFGEKRYRIPMPKRYWIDVREALKMENYPNERAISAIDEAIGAAADNETVTITFASMEAMAISRVLG